MHNSGNIIFISFLIIVLRTTATPPDPARLARFKQDIDNCRALNPATDETLENLHRKGALLDENDQDARCFVVCMMQRGELVDEEGHFNVDQAKQYILQRVPVLYDSNSDRPAQLAVDEAVDICSASTGEGKCMVNYKIWTCLYTKLHERT